MKLHLIQPKLTLASLKQLSLYSHWLYLKNNTKTSYPYAYM